MDGVESSRLEPRAEMKNQGDNNAGPSLEKKDEGGEQVKLEVDLE
jgi:hypothetical protein